MSKKGIEDLIKEMEIFVDSCRFQPLSSTKIIVPKEELMAMLRELRVKMPSEIDRCQKIVRNKEGIIAEAREQAEQMLSDATLEVESLVAEHEVVQLAQQRAQEVMNQAKREAEDIIAQANAEAGAILAAANQDGNSIRVGAMQYTEDALVEVENIMQNALVEGARRYNDMLDLIQQNLQVVTQNRQEISESLYGTPDNQYNYETAESATQEMPQEEETTESLYDYEEEE